MGFRKEILLLRVSPYNLGETCLHIRIHIIIFHSQNIDLHFLLLAGVLNSAFFQSYVTHALKVEGLRGIVTVPTKLESTTSVFAYGVDLFYTRIAPSKTYDSLTEDFSYALLLITIVALVVAIFVTWIMSEKKELRDKWR